MNRKCGLLTVLVFGFAYSCSAEEKAIDKPVELEVLKAYVGVWDAEIEVWAQGLDSQSMKFKGVETNRAYGEFWIASDLDTEFDGQIMKVHSIIGYDLDKKKLVGTVVDHGPYSAKLTGRYDKDSKTVYWKTEAKDFDGKRIVQNTSIVQKSPDKRVLVLSVPNKQKEGEFTKFMQIIFTKRK